MNVLVAIASNVSHRVKNSFAQYYLVIKSLTFGPLLMLLLRYLQYYIHAKSREIYWASYNG